MTEDKKGEWQPIETAPKDGSPVLLASHWEGYDLKADKEIDGWYIVTGCFYSAPGFDGEEDGWWQDNAAVGCRLPDAPTHWMSLPTPPVESRP